MHNNLKWLKNKMKTGTRVENQRIFILNKSQQPNNHESTKLWRSLGGFGWRDARELEVSGLLGGGGGAYPLNEQVELLGGGGGAYLLNEQVELLGHLPARLPAGRRDALQAAAHQAGNAAPGKRLLHLSQRGGGKKSINIKGAGPRRASTLRVF